MLLPERASVATTPCLILGRLWVYAPAILCVSGRDESTMTINRQGIDIRMAAAMMIASSA